MITDTLLFIIVILLAGITITNAFNYKKRYFNAGVISGTEKTANAIIESAKKGKEFNLANDKEKITLKIVKNA